MSALSAEKSGLAVVTSIPTEPSKLLSEQKGMLSKGNQARASRVVEIYPSEAQIEMVSSSDCGRARNRLSFGYDDANLA